MSSSFLLSRRVRLQQGLLPLFSRLCVLMAVPDSAICLDDQHELIDSGESESTFCKPPPSSALSLSDKLVYCTEGYDTTLQQPTVIPYIASSKEDEIFFQQQATKLHPPSHNDVDIDDKSLNSIATRPDDIAMCNIHKDDSIHEDDCSCIFPAATLPDDDDQTMSLTHIDIDELLSDNDGNDDKRKRRELKRQKKEKSELKKVRPKPNAFVAVQISSPAIRGRLQQVQDAMCNHNKQLHKILTSLKKLHITLMVIRMETDEDIERGINSLQVASEIIKSEFNGNPLELNLTGISSFGSKVIFANVSHKTEEDLQRISRIIQTVFESNNLPSTDKKKKITPHATIAKCSKIRSKISIPRESYSDFIDCQFGIENVTNIELLSMMKPEQDNGYYYCFASNQFSK